MQKGLGHFMDEKLHMSRQQSLAAQRASCILGCIKGSMASRSMEVILQLCSAPIRLGALNPALGGKICDPGPVGVPLEEGHKDDQSAEAPLL